MGTYHYRTHPTERGFLVSCVEMEMVSEGKTAEEAARKLAKAITLRLEGCEAVAPPSNPSPVSVRLLEMEEDDDSVATSRSPQGPGEA
jgi:hypothetical protein